MKHFCLLILLWLSIAYNAFGQTERNYAVSTTDTFAILEEINKAALLEISDPDSCIALLKKDLHLSREINYNHGIASALVHLGMANMAKGDVENSLETYLESRPYIQKCYDDKKLTALFYTGIGTPYLRKSDYTQAGIYYYKALQLVNRDSLQYTDIACRLYLNISNLWCALRKYNYALDYINRSEQIALSKKDTLALIPIYGNQSVVAYCRGEAEKSDRYMHLALALANQKHVVRAQQILLTNIGTSLRQNNKSAEAIPYLEKALLLADDEHAYQHNLHAYYNLAFAYYETGNYTKAQEYAFSTLNKSEQSGMDKEHAGEAMQVIANVYEKEGNYKAANEWLNKYFDFTENILEQQADAEMHQLEENYRVAEKNKEIVQKQLLLSKRELEIKKKNIWIGGITGCILLLAMLLLVVIRNNKHKQYVQASQISYLKQEKELVYLQAIIDGEERERARISRELHDGIGGMLSSAKMHLSAIKESNAEVIDRSKLDNVIQMLRETTSEVRRTAHNLMPDILTKNNLRDALLAYCTDITASGVLEIDFQFYGQLEEIGKSVELTLYRITQELLQNIMKHAHAQHVSVQIVQDKRRLNLIVEDDGIGFELAEISNGYGFQHLQFRVQALQGYISIDSTKEKGTSVYIEFDLENLKNA